VDLRGLSPWNFKGMLNMFNDITPAKGILYITNDKTTALPEKTGMDRIAGNKSGVANIRLTAAAGDRLKRISDFSVTVEIEDTKVPEGEGYNVVGQLKGKGKDVIIVGAAYDGPGDDQGAKYQGASEAAAVSVLMEIYGEMARKKDELNKTFIFALWDGSYSRDRGSLRFIEKYGEQEKILKFPASLSANAAEPKGDYSVGAMLYIDLGPIGRGEAGTVMFDSSGCLPRDEFSMEFIKALRGSRLKDRPKLVDGKITTLEQLDFALKNVNVIEFAQTEEGVCRTSDDTAEKLNGKSVTDFGNYLANELLRYGMR